MTDRLVSIKTGETAARLAQAGLLDFWRQKLECFVRRLKDATFHGLLLDYDGTVYDGGQYENAWPDAEMTALLNGVLARGCRIGIATGRGDTIRHALRHCIEPAFWRLVWIGYQDGAEIGRLDDDSLPTPCADDAQDAAIAQARRRLAACFAGWVNPPRMRVENMLIGLYCSGPEQAGGVFRLCSGLGLPLKVFSSGRMVDVVAPAASKRSLARFVAPQAEKPENCVLAVGDSGEWPGNDCELLSLPCSLGVGALSANPDTCWRLCAPGADAGVALTKALLGALRGKNGALRFSPDWL